MPAPVTAGESLAVSFTNFSIRAQCLYYANCGLSRLTNTDRISTVKEVMQKTARLSSLVASAEKSDLGIIGRAEGTTVIDNNEFMFRARFYWGECTRLTVFFGTLRDAPDGVSQWLSTLATVRRR
jgi:hypothetical protein